MNWLKISLTLFFFSFLCSSYAQNICVSPNETNASVSEEFSIDVMVQNVTDLSTFEFRIAFNKDVLNAISVEKGILWDNPNYIWCAGEVDNSVGVIGFTSGASASESGPIGVSVGSDGGVLAKIRFRTIAEGISAISLTDVFMADVNGNEINTSVTNGLVNSTIPNNSNVSVVLLEPNTGSSMFTVNKGDQFELQVRINAGTIQINSAAIYLTFDETKLQLFGDEYADVNGFQPFKQGTFIGAGEKNWITNSIAQEPNGIDGTQLSYAEGIFNGSVSGPGVIASVRFIAMEAGATEVKIDFDLASARNTEFGIIESPYVIGPDSHTNANITINGIPSIDNLAISPSSPLTMDDLIGSYTYNDPDNDPETSREIRWYKNNTLQSTYDNQLTIPNSATTKGDTWYFTVRVSDGKIFSEIKTSPSVTIGNTAPSVTSLSISPSSPSVNTNLTGSYSYSDLDMDPEGTSEIKWYKNDILQSEYNSLKVIPSSALSKGDTWYFTVIPHDGFDYGEMKTSPSVTIINNPPNVSNLLINPSSALTTDDLTASYTYSDADNDSDKSEITWFKNNVPQINYNDLKVVPSSATSKGDVWYFTVKPYDGYDYGDIQTSPSVTIGNTPPSATSLTINPSSPKKTDDLIGSYTYDDIDGDAEGASEIKWYKNGILQLENQLAVPSSALSKGDTWYFTVRPYDGSDYGEIQTSPSVTIVNIPPSVTNLAINPSSPRTNDDLTGSYIYSDTEGDTETGSEIRWYKDGVLQTKYNDQLTIPSNATKKNEIWYFTVKPYDGSDYGELKTSPSVTISNSPPVVSLNSAYDTIIGVATTFTPTVEDLDNDTLTYKWDFDERNGTSDIDSTDPSPTYTFTEIREYTVNMVVSDGTDTVGPVTTNVDVKVDINGTVRLQGYSNNSANLTINVRPVGQKNSLRTFDITTNDGSFNILTDITPGLYDITAKEKNYLRAIARNVTISGNKENIIFDPEISGMPVGELRGGDCNNDNAVTLADFSLLSKYFGQVNEDVDINNDGIVNILDFSMLSTNFGYVGVDGRLMAPKQTMPNGNNNNIRFIVYTDRDPKTISPGDEFDVNIKVDNAWHLKGYSIRLQYDPNIFQLAELYGKPALEGAFLRSNAEGRSTLFLSNRQDSEGGLLLSSCIVNDTKGVNGAGVIATLRFKLIGNSPGSVSIYQPSVVDANDRINELPDASFTIQAIPKQTLLLPNYPNPFNPETWIPYQLSEANDVSIDIYNLNGQLVRSLKLGYKQPGFYINKENSAYWDGRNEFGESVSSGIYFYMIKTGNFVSTRKMTILR
ncbi:MAG: cohesin domain-containing protein [bacterium]